MVDYLSKIVIFHRYDSLLEGITWIILDEAGCFWFMAPPWHWSQKSCFEQTFEAGFWVTASSYRVVWPWGFWYLVSRMWCLNTCMPKIYNLELPKPLKGRSFWKYQLLRTFYQNNGSHAKTPSFCNNLHFVCALALRSVWGHIFWFAWFADTATDNEIKWESKIKTKK